MLLDTDCGIQPSVTFDGAIISENSAPVFFANVSSYDFGEHPNLRFVYSHLTTCPRLSTQFDTALVVPRLVTVGSVGLSRCSASCSSHRAFRSSSVRARKPGASSLAIPGKAPRPVAELEPAFAVRPSLEVNVLMQYLHAFPYFAVYAFHALVFRVCFALLVKSLAPMNSGALHSKISIEKLLARSNRPAVKLREPLNLVLQVILCLQHVTIKHRALVALCCLLGTGGIRSDQLLRWCVDHRDERRLFHAG